MHRYAISEAKGAGRSPSYCAHWGSLASGLAVAMQRMAGSDGPNGPGDNRGFRELCRVWILRMPGQVSAQFAGCLLFSVRRILPLMDEFLSSPRSFLCSFLLPHCTRRLGHKMSSRRIWLDMVQDCWEANLHVVCNMSSHLRACWMAYKQTTNQPNLQTCLAPRCLWRHELLLWLWGLWYWLGSVTRRLWFFQKSSVQLVGWCMFFV